MSKKFVRVSKFRHAYGVAQKRENCYEDIRVTKNSWDSNFCDVNPKYLAVVTESAGGGAFLVLPLLQTGRLPVDYPLITGHRASILDVQWCPHDDNFLASASEDCSIKFWEIPKSGLIKKTIEPVLDIGRAHERRAYIVRWHPSAADVLLSVGGDCKVNIWDINKGNLMTSIGNHPDQIMSACWNYDGSLIMTTCKDKMIRLIDPRSGSLAKAVSGHTGLKPSRGLFLKDGRCLTTGFSKMSVRQYALWELQYSDKPLVCDDIDSSNGVVFPFYDPDINMIYLAGKGDSSIRYFEYTSEDPYIHYINTFSSPEPFRGVAFMPKRGLDIGHCEIARMYQLKNSNYCQIVGIYVPRKSEDFQGDLYPETASSIAAVSSDEWWSGTNANPKMVKMTASSTTGSNLAEQVTVERPQMTRTSHLKFNQKMGSDVKSPRIQSDVSDNARNSGSAITDSQHFTGDLTRSRANANTFESFARNQFEEIYKLIEQLSHRVDQIERVLSVKK